MSQRPGDSQTVSNRQPFNKGKGAQPANAKPNTNLDEFFNRVQEGATLLIGDPNKGNKVLVRGINKSGKSLVASAASCTSFEELSQFHESGPVVKLEGTNCSPKSYQVVVNPQSRKLAITFGGPHTQAKR